MAAASPKKRFSLGDAVLMHDGSIGIVLSQEGGWPSAEPRVAQGATTVPDRGWVRVATLGPEGHLIQADFRADYLRRAVVSESREQ